jgi:pimeloyl-ACP methyl ester carboxylesterase
LILEAPHVFVEEVGLESITAIATDYRAAGVSVPSSERASPGRDAGRMPANRPQDAGAPSVLKQRLARYHGKNVDETFWGWNDVWLNPEFRSWNIEEYLPQISGPVLLIQGQDDQYGTLDQVKAIDAGCQAPVRTVLVPDCGHSPHIDQPARTLEAMREFVEEVK